MTVEEVERRVESIRLMSGDDETAHSEEDALRADVLFAIMNGAENPGDLARAALKTDDIEFARCCA